MRMQERRMERPPIEPEVSPEKRELLELEESGLYVFHGSGKKLETLTPQQAVDDNTGPDGKPAIFAHSKADFAIFMAIVNKENCPNGSKTEAGTIFDDEDNTYTLNFGATQGTLDQLTDDAHGYVYVFEKSSFQPYTKYNEFTSNVPQEPIKIIEVTQKDLPQGIEVVN